MAAAIQSNNARSALIGRPRFIAPDRSCHFVRGFFVPQGSEGPIAFEGEYGGCALPLFTLLVHGLGLGFVRGYLGDRRGCWLRHCILFNQSKRPLPAAAYASFA